MSVTRSMHLMKRLYLLGRKSQATPSVQQVRNSGGLYSYRQPGYEEPHYRIVTAKIMSAFTVWWILWHLWHEPGHVVGEAEFAYPDPSAWTDEELGIPPDEMD